MSFDDVSPDEMGTNRHDEGDELERLLEGSADAREHLPELAIFVDDLQAMPAPSPGAEDLHVVAMMSESSRLLAEKGDPVARPVSKVHGPAPQASGLPMRRSTPMVKLLLTKVMAPLIAVFTLMGGLAYAHALPAPLQDAVSGAADVVGIDLSSDDDEADDPVAEVEDDETEPSDEPTDEPSDDPTDDADDGEADDSGNSGPGGAGDDDEADDNSGPGGGDESDDDNSGPGGGDESDDDNSGPGDDDESDDDSSGSGGGGGDDDESDDDSSGSGGGDDDESDDEADLTEEDSEDEA